MSKQQIKGTLMKQKLHRTGTSAGWLAAVLLLATLDAQRSTLFALGGPPGALVAYQGRVTDKGTNFNGLGRFKFALVTSYNSSSPASASARLTGNSVTSCTVNSGGTGYTTRPAVTF